MAYTEFYCNASTGSNLNSGSDTGTSVYTSTNGNWTSGTGAFIPTDGSNPATASPGVTVGQFASVYIDGATVGVFIGRVTAVTNAVNGQITVSTTAKAGTAPTTLANTRTIKVGGVWKGPNAASSFPFGMASIKTATDSSGNIPRLNFKNNATYAMTSSVTATGGAFTIVQGYSSTVNDGGKALVDMSTNVGTVWVSDTDMTLIDMIFSSSATSGTNAVIQDSASPRCTYIRCVAKGGRNAGFRTGSGAIVYECEAYGNNTSNSSTNGNRGGFSILGSTPSRLFRCYSHDNTGSNAQGFETASGFAAFLSNCIADSNGNAGYRYNINGSGTTFMLQNCDAYNNGSDGIVIDRTSGTMSFVIIENCNLINNTGQGINNNTAAGELSGGLVYNCGYGAGTQANDGGDATLGSLVESGKITYASNVTPWVDPANGDFRVNLAAANWTGRAVFTETDPGLSAPNSVGYPDVGAVQSKTGTGGTFSKEVSYGFGS